MAQTSLRAVDRTASKQNIKGNFGADISVVSHAVISADNSFVLDPAHNVGSYAGSTRSRAAALILDDIATGTKYAGVMLNGTLTWIEQ